MKRSTILFGTVFLLSLKVIGFVRGRYTDFISYQWNATSFTLQVGVDASDGVICKGCLSNETRKPICQRRLYAPIASCYNPQKRNLSFDLTLRSTGSLQDVSGSQPLSSEDRSRRKLTFQPWKRALVVNFKDLTFIQYSSFTLKWNSTSSTQLFTVDYSVDGIHWNNYTEDERVKVFQVQRDQPTQCMCRKLLTRFVRIKSRNEFSIGTSLKGYYEAAYCPTSRKHFFNTTLPSSASMNHTGLYFGCFGGTGELFYSGLHGYTEIDQKMCIKRCSELGFRYAAIQSGLQCFCGNNVSSVPLDQSECLLPFISDAFYSNPMRFYRIPREKLSCKNVSFSDKRRRLGEILTVQATTNNHEIGMVWFTVTYGDGNELTFCDLPGTYFYRNPGLYKAVITAQDLRGNQLNFSEYIEIADNLTQLVLKCPKASPQGQMVRCEANVARALNVQGNVSVENEQLAKLPQIPDSRISRVGEDIPRYLPTTQEMLQKLRRSSVGVTFVLTENKVQEEGYLASLEFVVAEPGPIRIQVLRRSHDTEASQEVPPLNALKCTEPRKFFVDKGDCCSPSSSCNEIDSAAAAVANKKYLIISDITLAKHNSTGYHCVDVTTLIQVKLRPGDMFAWLSSNGTGKIAVAGETSSNQGLAFKGIVDGHANGKQILGPGLHSNRFNMTFGLNAHVVPLSFFSVMFHLAKITTHSVLVTLWDGFGNTEVGQKEVVLQRQITGLSLNLSGFVPFGKVSNLELSIVNGTNVTYIWNFGKNLTKEVFKETSVTHTFTFIGAHNISVVAYNNVSVAQRECFGSLYVLYAVENLTVSSLAPAVPNGNVTIVVSLSRGSFADLTVSLGDGSPEFSLSNIDVRDIYVVSINHSYSAVGVFTVRALATNVVSNASALLNVRVQLPIAGFNVSTPPGVQSSHENLQVNVSVAQGTDVQYNLSLFENSSLLKFQRAFGNFTVVVFPKHFLRPGVYFLKVTAYNSVSSNASVSKLAIETPITNVKLTAKPTETGKVVRFVFYYQTGSNVSVRLWKSMSNESIKLGPFRANIFFIVPTLNTMVFASPGVYTARANYSNVLGYMVVDTPVVVQEPVKDVEVLTDRFVPLPPGFVVVYVKQIGKLPTNATVICWHGDGSVSDTLDFNGDFNVSNRYNHSGDYRLVVNASNLVSFVSKELSVTVLKVPTYLIITAKSAADALSSESFSSQSGDTFPFEFSLLFTVKHDGDPDKNFSFRFDFGDGSGLNATGTKVSANHTYNSTGEYNVTVTLIHRFKELRNSTKITIKESLTGLTISDDAPAVVNETTTFTLRWNTLGTGTLIEVYFGDGEQILFRDNRDNVGSTRGAVRQINALQKSISFNHTYNEVKVYYVTVKGWNQVSSSRKLSHRTIDVEKKCRYPSPVILGVGINPQVAPHFNKDREIIVYTRIVIDCRTSYETGFVWKAYEGTCHDSENNQSTQIIINSDMSKPSLTIPPYSLPHGPICLKFQAKMKYIVDGIDSNAQGYLSVIPGKLKARILGGNFRIVGSQRTITINGSISEDSDQKGETLSGVQFLWFCRRINETFSPGVEEMPPVSLAGPLNHSGNGCGGHGPRRLIYSSHSWEISPGVLMKDGKYVIKLVIRKDSREDAFEQIIEVVRGIPPEVVIGCKINCEDKVNKQSALTVSCNCGNCAQEGFVNVFYGWELYVKNESSGIWESVKNLNEKAVTNINRETLVLRKDTLNAGHNYRLTCGVKTEAGTEGRSEQNFITNTSPQNGTCSIYPTEGEALKTFFQIKCPDWQDEDGYMTYKVFKRTKLLQHWNGPVLNSTLLPPGKLEEDYTYSITVTISDKYGSFSQVFITVKVTKAEMTQGELFNMVTSKDGLLTNMLLSGDTQGVAQLVRSFASELAGRKAVTNGSSGDGREGKEGEDDHSEMKKANIQMKETLLGALEKLEPESIDTVGVLIEAMAAITKNVEEVSTTSQMSMLRILSTAASTLSVKKRANSLDAIERVGAGIMDSIGNLFGASKYQQDMNTRLKDQAIGQNVADLNDEGDKLNDNARNMTKAAMKVVHDILDTLSEFLVVGQGQVILESESMSAIAKKLNVEDLATANIFINGGSFVLPSMEDILRSWQNPDCYVLAKGLNAKDNPFIWDNSSTGVNSNCLGLRFQDCHGNPVNVANLSDPINITIPRQGNSPEPANFAIEQKTLKSHKITIDDSSYSMHAIVQPRVGNCSCKFQLFLRKDEKPTTETYDFNWTMDVMPGVYDWKDGLSMFVSNLQLQNLSSDTGVYYLSVYVDFDDQSQKQSTCAELNYTLSTFMSSCTFWDDEEEKWKGSGCEVTSETTFDTTVCRCTHLTNFGGGFLVAPNPIDFDAAFKGFTDIASNPIVFATVLTIFGLYFIGVIWARWRDKKDLEKIGVTPLLSNDPRDTYGYEITLQTGFQQKRRTTADVFVQLYGSISDSEPRMLKDPKRAKFGRGEIDQFLFTVPQTLGRIREIHIWHNNAGKSPAWYLFRVLVRDLHTDEKWWFVCDQWLAVEEGDGAVDRRLQVATKAELTKFNFLFVNATRKNLLDDHLWLSVFTRPPKSTFTRVQRLSCCLSLLLNTMLANLMFYQVGGDDNSTASQSIYIGPFIFSVKQIMIGVQSSFVVLPVNIIIVSIFRKLKPKKDKVNSQSQKYGEIEEEQEPRLVRPKTEGEDVTRADEYQKRNSKKTTFSWGTVVNIFKKEEGLGDHPKKPKNRFLFPHWCIYIAYMLVVISSLTSALFCMLYGFTFGKEKSEKWLTSMLVSFFQSVIVIQPFKVLLLAAFFALIIKDPNKEDEQEDAPDPALNTDEELISVDEDKGPLSFRLHSKPPDAKKLEAARKLRLKQCEMKAIIKEIVIHFLVVCVVLIVAYGNHDSRAFNMTNEVKKVLVEGDPNKMSFDLVKTKEAFFDWARNSFIPTLFPSSVQDEYPYVGIMRSKQGSNVLGIARIRQLRVKKDTCKVPQYMSNIIPDCIDFYSWSGEERRDFVKGWLDPSQVNESENKKTERERFASPWHYQTVLEASSFPYMGRISSYRGGGFIVQLGADEVTTINDLNDLNYWGWSDRYTRALFTELSLYNININLLCVVTLLFEDLPTGGGQTHVNIQAIRLYRYISNFSAALMACEVIFAFLLLTWIVRDAKRLWKERKAFWKNVWNIVDIGITSLSITSLVLYFFRLAFLNKAVHELRKNRSKFVSFQYVVLLNEGVNAVIAFAVLLVSLKFLRMLRFNRKISVLSSTIKASAKKLASFMVMFLVIFMAYCFLVLLVFGPVLEDYRSIIRCMVSMMTMVLGSSEFYDFVEVNRFIGPAVFFSFMVIFQFIIMNMFIGILCDSFNDVRTDAIKQSNEYEILEFMTNRFKAFLGRFVEPPIRPEYNWPKSELEKKVEIIEEKAEATMFFMRNLCAEDTRQTKWFEPGKWTRKKTIVVSLVLNADVEIMENDLWDGIGAINTVVERYSENALDRMLLASRIRRRCLASSQSGVSSMLHGDNFEDSESEDKDTADDSDNNKVEIKKKMTEDCPAENKDEDTNMEKEEDVDKKKEEMEELMEIIEEDFDENDEGEDEQDDEDKCDEEKWEKEIELELGSLGSLASHKSNTPVPLKGTVSPSMPNSRPATQGCSEALELAANKVETDGSQVNLSCGLAGGTALSVQTPASETPAVSARTVDGLLSAEGSSNRTEPSVLQVTFGNCTTIFIKEANCDNILHRSHSDA